jgi:hypothetical protein
VTEVVMWEVRAAPGRLDALVAFADEHAAPQAQLYRADDPEPRLVVIDPSGRGMPQPPADLVTRPPHSWRFESVPRNG